MASQRDDFIVVVAFDGIEVGGAESIQDFSIPLWIEVVKFRVPSSKGCAGRDHPLLTRRPCFGGGIAVRDELPLHLGRGTSQPGYWRVMRQSAGADQQHSLVESGQIATQCRPELADPPHRGERWCYRVDEDRNHGVRVGRAKQDLKRLHRAVIDGHVQRYGNVDILLQDSGGACLGQFSRYVEGTRGSVEVPDATRGEPDAVGRHQVVEESVVMAGAKTTMTSGSNSSANARASAKAEATSSATSGARSA